jgi:hypothetical protein
MYGLVKTGNLTKEPTGIPEVIGLPRPIAVIAEGPAIGNKQDEVKYGFRAVGEEEEEDINDQGP